VLAIAAAKLRMKPGDINVPVISELKMVRMRATSKAWRNPNNTRVVRVTMLASPNRNPGMG
jgi:hypothetical protein